MGEVLALASVCFIIALDTANGCHDIGEWAMNVDDVSIACFARELAATDLE